MKRSLPLILVLLLGAASASWWWSQRAPQAQALPAGGGASGAGASRSSAPQTVTVAAVQQRDVPVMLEAAGSVVSLNSVDVRAQVAATVRSVAIQEGQFVRRGDALFTFDDRADRANLERARAQLARDRAVLADLQRQLDRARDLRAQNFVAQSNVDAVQTQVDAQLAAIRADEATVQASEVALSFGNISAPLAGRAGAVGVYPGSLVQPGGAALVTISQIDPIGVAFNVPEAQLANLMRSQAAAGKPAAGKTRTAGARPAGAKASDARADARPASPAEGTITVSLPTGERGSNAPPAESWQGRIVFVDNAVDATTGTIKVKGSLANPKQALWPGQYVTVRMTLRTIQDALVVPVAALVQRGNERSVYLVNAEGKAEQRVVQQRYVFGDNAVVEGLAAGDRIVVEGKQNLRSGTPVREAGPQGARAASGAASAASPAGATASGNLAEARP
jgi:RND family efflux transporter MFP subunit